MISYEIEPLSDALIEEVMPILDIHRKELQSYEDMRLNPDWDMYRKAEEMGMFVWLIARDDDREIVGYAAFLLHTNPHYKDFVYATEDVFYVVNDKRGKRIGVRLVRLSEEILKGRGVDVITHHAKFSNNFAPFLEKLGYHKTETILAKRISDAKSF